MYSDTNCLQIEDFKCICYEAILGTTVHATKVVLTSTKILFL